MMFVANKKVYQLEIVGIIEILDGDIGNWDNIDWVRVVFKKYVL